MRTISTVIAAAMLAIAPAAAQQSPSIACRPIVAHVESFFTITVPANRTTGYDWVLEDPVNPAVLRFRSKIYVRSNGLPGAPGLETWTFSTYGRGHALIALKYVRPWEKAAPPVKEALYVVAVR